MKNYYEMKVHTALNTHKEPINVLLVGENKAVEAEIKRHDCVKNLKVVKKDEVESLGIKSFDVVIADEFNEAFVQILKDDGLAVIDAVSYFDDLDAHKETLKRAGEGFYIAMPFRIDSGKSVMTPVLVSKKYHPTADINLQRADLMDGLNYYNSDIHIASFVKPTYIFKALLGVAKN